METTVFSGKIGEVIHTEQPDGRVFEKYRRAPGVRLVIISPENNILITKEYRQETGNVDLRLPGGKVCDTLEEYHTLLKNGADLTHAAELAAIKEAREETGLIICNPELIAIAKSGATVEWDLYYFVVHDYKSAEEGQNLETGEEIQVGWMSPAEIKTAIEAGQMQEWRSVGVLMGKVIGSYHIAEKTEASAEMSQRL